MITNENSRFIVLKCLDLCSQSTRKSSTYQTLIINLREIVSEINNDKLKTHLLKQLMLHKLDDMNSHERVKNVNEKRKIKKKNNLKSFTQKDISIDLSINSVNSLNEETNTLKNIWFNSNTKGINQPYYSQPINPMNSFINNQSYYMNGSLPFSQQAYMNTNYNTNYYQQPNQYFQINMQNNSKLSYNDTMNMNRNYNSRILNNPIAYNRNTNKNYNMNINMLNIHQLNNPISQASNSNSSYNSYFQNASTTVNLDSSINPLSSMSKQTQNNSRVIINNNDKNTNTEGCKYSKDFDKDKGSKLLKMIYECRKMN
jgi:hypothetical protein